MVLIPTDIAQALLLDRLYDCEKATYNRSKAYAEATGDTANAVFSLLYEVEGAFPGAFAHVGTGRVV